MYSGVALGVRVARIRFQPSNGGVTQTIQTPERPVRFRIRKTRPQRMRRGEVERLSKKAPKSVGSNGETVFRLKGERAFEVDVWTFNRRCRLL